MIRTLLVAISLACAAPFLTKSCTADETGFQNALQQLSEYAPVSTSIGVSRNGVAIPAFLTREMLNLDHDQTRILVVSNSRPGSALSVKLVEEWNSYCSSRQPGKSRPDVQFGVVPFASPDHLDASTDDADQQAWCSHYPPSGSAYSDPRNAERHYLWRWIGMLAPDIVIVLRDSDVSTLVIPESQDLRQLEIKANWKVETAEPGSLADALTRENVADVASVSAVEVRAGKEMALFAEFAQLAGNVRSNARRELLRRAQRTPVEVATELAEVYGDNLRSVAYIPALALIGRVRLAELTGDDRHLRAVLKTVEPYANGSRSTLGRNPSGSTLSGHLIFGELADATEDTRYVALAQTAADLGFDSDGNPHASMPFHNEMSDAVFMGTPILVQTGRLTGDARYFDMAARHLRFMLALNLRNDGLHQHSPLDPEHTAWGRGNGFPALGLAISLSDLPADSEHRPLMLNAFRDHLLTMIDHQDEMGMWHQIVDRPESYREFTVTCMTTFAIVRGLRNGWLNRDTFEPFVQRAWNSIKCRIGPRGRLVDVCTGTGKQKDRQAYYDRTAILGRDDRGGAMALMVSTELARGIRDRVIDLPGNSTATR